MIMTGELCPPAHTRLLPGGHVHTAPLPTLHRYILLPRPGASRSLLYDHWPVFPATLEGLTKAREISVSTKDLSKATQTERRTESGDEAADLMSFKKRSYNSLNRLNSLSSALILYRVPSWGL